MNAPAVVKRWRDVFMDVVGKVDWTKVLLVVLPASIGVFGKVQLDQSDRKHAQADTLQIRRMERIELRQDTLYMVHAADVAKLRAVMRRHYKLVADDLEAAALEPPPPPPPPPPIHVRLWRAFTAPLHWWGH